MLWIVLLLGLAALVAWDFLRFKAKRNAEQDTPKIGRERVGAVASRADRVVPSGPETAGQSTAPVDKRPTLSESVSVVLRRQVPPRAEAHRSWLGGLPMLPDDVTWPGSVSKEYPERGERPLHFVAQIACGDLPAELWGGLGPRSGALLFFVDPNQGVPDGPDAFRVMHVDGLCAERPAPNDLGPVHDGMYTGPRYDYLASEDDVPSLWRRWPVDLVVVPNEARTEGQRTLVAPENFAEMLYAGEEIAPESRRPQQATDPFTWRGALFVVDGLERQLSKPLSPLRIPDALVEKLNRPGYFAEMMATRASYDAAWEATNRTLSDGFEPEDEADRDRRAKSLAWVAERRAHREALAAFLAKHPTADSIIDYLRDADQRRRAWRDEARERVAAERKAVLVHDLDEPIDAEAWEAMKARLDSLSFRAWTHHWTSRDGDSLHVEFAETRLSLGHDQHGGDIELIADYYVDPRRRDLIPPALVAAFEPLWRRLYNNRPHRIGGYHDRLQSDAEIGPASELLLFQIASDDAMNWCWGDVGAYYVFIRPDDLANRHFEKAWITLESH